MRVLLVGAAEPRGSAFPLHAPYNLSENSGKLKDAGKPASYARDKAAEEISKHSGLPVETHFGRAAEPEAPKEKMIETLT